MKLCNRLAAVSTAALLTAVAGASAAEAAVVTLDFHLQATNFVQLFGSGAVQPFPTVSGDYLITFDNSASFGKTAAGVTVSNLNLAGPTFIAYDLSKDLLTIGSNPNVGGYGFNSGQYGFYLQNVSTAAYSSSQANYGLAGVSWRSRTVQITAAPAAVPEPASWAMMLAGFGLIGGAMRGRRKALASFG